MYEVRETRWGSTPVFAVEYDEGGALREATFFSRQEAEAFAAEQGPARASLAAIQRANRTIMDRIKRGRPPEPVGPRTLRDLLKRIRCGRHTTMGGVR